MSIQQFQYVWVIGRGIDQFWVQFRRFLPSDDSKIRSHRDRCIVSLDRCRTKGWGLFLNKDRRSALNRVFQLIRICDLEDRWAWLSPFDKNLDGIVITSCPEVSKRFIGYWRIVVDQPMSTWTSHWTINTVLRISTRCRIEWKCHSRRGVCTKIVHIVNDAAWIVQRRDNRFDHHWECCESNCLNGPRQSWNGTGAARRGWSLRSCARVKGYIIVYTVEGSCVVKLRIEDDGCSAIRIRRECKGLRLI